MTLDELKWWRRRRSCRLTAADAVPESHKLQARERERRLCLRRPRRTALMGWGRAALVWALARIPRSRLYGRLPRCRMRLVGRDAEAAACRAAPDWQRCRLHRPSKAREALPLAAAKAWRVARDWPSSHRRLLSRALRERQGDEGEQDSAAVRVSGPCLRLRRSAAEQARVHGAVAGSAVMAPNWRRCRPHPLWTVPADRRGASAAKDLAAA